MTRYEHRCEAEVTKGVANCATFEQCSRWATMVRSQDIKHPEIMRPCCTQHAKAHDKGRLNGWVQR